MLIWQKIRNDELWNKMIFKLFNAFKNNFIFPKTKIDNTQRKKLIDYFDVKKKKKD